MGRADAVAASAVLTLANGVTLAVMTGLPVDPCRSCGHAFVQGDGLLLHPHPLDGTGPLCLDCSDECYKHMFAAMFGLPYVADVASQKEPLVTGDEELAREAARLSNAPLLHPDTLAVYHEAKPPCTDCEGTGWYVGLHERKPCPSCKGDA